MGDRRVRGGFARACRYEAHAPVQRLAAMRLARLLTTLPLPAGGNVLEIGCGTGLLSRRLRRIFPDARLYLSDLAPEMVGRCRNGWRGKACFFAMDGEKPAVRAGFDLIVASLAFQWFADPAAAIRELRGLLAPGGRLLFATLGPETFRQWRAAHEAEGLRAGTLDLPALEEMLGLLPGGWGREERVVARYESGRAFLRQLKGAGAATAHPDHRPLEAVALRRVLARLEAEGEVAMTWHLLYALWTAPP